MECGEGIALVPSGVRYLRAPGVTFAAVEPETTHVGLSIALEPRERKSIPRDFLARMRATKKASSAPAKMSVASRIVGRRLPRLARALDLLELCSVREALPVMCWSLAIADND